jgi:hypothetical protein
MEDAKEIKGTPLKSTLSWLPPPKHQSNPSQPHFMPVSSSPANYHSPIMTVQSVPFSFDRGRRRPQRYPSELNREIQEGRGRGRGRRSLEGTKEGYFRFSFLEDPWAPLIQKNDRGSPPLLAQPAALHEEFSNNEEEITLEENLT